MKKVIILREVNLSNENRTDYQISITEKGYLCVRKISLYTDVKPFNYLYKNYPTIENYNFNDINDLYDYLLKLSFFKPEVIE